jgi:hypothetical protein
MTSTKQIDLGFPGLRQASRLPWTGFVGPVRPGTGPDGGRVGTPGALGTP